MTIEIVAMKTSQGMSPNTTLRLFHRTIFRKDNILRLKIVNEMRQNEVGAATDRRFVICFCCCTILGCRNEVEIFATASDVLNFS